MDDAPAEAPFVAQRMGAHGVDRLGILPGAHQADLYDLARLLASTPGEGDPATRFAARAAAIDQRTLPRSLRLPAAAEPAVETGGPAAPTRRPSGAMRAATPPLGTTSVPAPDAPVPPRRPTPPPMPEPVEPRDAPVRLLAPLAKPDTGDPMLVAAMDDLELATDVTRCGTALDALVLYTDLAFRQGRFDAMIEGLAALIAIEHVQLAEVEEDERRPLFNHAVRRLARPVVLRQVAVLRHQRADSALASERLQAALFRFGIDGAEALLDEFNAAPSSEARTACIDALRALPRRWDALRALAGDADPTVVRQAIAAAGALRDDGSRDVLQGLLAHPDERTRRDAVSALGRFEAAEALDVVSLALQDESPMVRLRAVTTLAPRRDPRLFLLLEALLKKEAQREVALAAVEALGRLGTPEAAGLLIPLAQGGGTSPLRDSSELRIQACTALVMIRSPQAMAAVQALREDRDRAVRQASMRLIASAQARRRATTAGIQVVEG
ncbi:MAG: HEAT repeat domain-containing protein [Gemmatimonadaceae bacterium]|nr:HEAT repeat domain-containing protein [Gemmatimonadaceae bacterium]